jgi:VWFA-related protein
MRRFHPVAVLICLLAACAFLTAQQAPSPAADPAGAQAAAAGSDQPQRIHLDVLVKDHSGQPLRGLTAQDFTVLDSGQPQKLATFNPVNTKDHPEAVHVLIVIDMINIGFDHVAWAREQLGEYLKQEGGSLSHPTSIAALTENGLRMMSGSTTDGNVLQAEFQKMGTDLRAVNRSAGWAGLDELMQTSLQQFSQILAVEQTRPGRKLLLFISPGWPMLAGQGSEEDLAAAQWVFNVEVRLTDAIRDARTAIYGLTPLDLGARGAHNPFYYQSFLKPVSNVKQAEYPFLGLGVFAIHSGGRVMVTGRSVTGEINDALHDAGSYYEISYDAPPAGGPDQYHAINVRVNQPGATVQTLTGYYADPQDVGPKAKEKH